MEIKAFPSKQELGLAIAKHVLDGILGTDGDRFTLGVPTGATPMPFLDSFLAMAKGLPKAQRDQIAKKLYLVVMDDFVDPVTHINMPVADDRSAVGFVQTHFTSSLQDILPSANMDARILFPQSGQVGSLKNDIIDNGGIDMQIIATDPFEGHVAQNFPGQPYRKTEEEKCAPLSDAFIQHHDWAKQFHGVTFDLSDFVDMVSANSRGQFLFMLWGEAKHAVLRRFLDSREYNPQLPISFLWLASERSFVFSDYTPSNELNKS